GKRFAKVAISDMRKLIDAAGYQKALETKNSRFPQTAELQYIAGNDPAPESGIDVQLAFCLADFFPIRGFRRCCRNAVERHLDQCCDAARGRRLGSSLKAFPLRAARLIDMHMRIDNTRHHNEFARVVLRNSDRHLVVRANGGDDSTAN